MLSRKLSRRGARPRSNAAVEKKLKLLKAGGYKSKSGWYALPATKTLREVIDVLKLDASWREVPPEVAARFPWKEAERYVRDIATREGVDPKLVLQALDPSRAREKKPPKKKR